MNQRRILLMGLLIISALTVRGYRIITPEPFSIAGKNYFKLQVQKEKNESQPDSVFFDVLYNTGSGLTTRLGSSLSTVITLNQFNDGVFFVKARVYHEGRCDTLGSKYDPAGIPVILDRRLAFNETIFKSHWIRSLTQLNNLPPNAGYDFPFNNNNVHFSSGWNTDSLYFIFHIRDAHLNSREPGFIDLFQEKKFLKTLWNSDCIELGFDMLHDRGVWKGKDDYELLADVDGHFAGNRWSAADSFYTHWGDHTKVLVERKGSLNNNQNTDEGYTIYISIPWSELNYSPDDNNAIGFDLQLYDKDAELDDAFRTSISGTNPESNDNTSEWTSLLLEKKPANFSYIYLLLLVPALAFGYYYYYRRIKKHQQTPPPGIAPVARDPNRLAVYTDSIQKALAYIAAHYHDPELSRQEIAEQVFISEKYLSSLFKKETGTNLVTYINELRIKESVELLQTTRLPIADIAFKVGFNSLQNFNKNFRAITQQSPSGLRRL